MTTPPDPASASGAPALARRLTLFDATMIVVSGIIGSGIFINPHVVAERVGTPLLILAAWVAGGLIAVAGALVFAELSTVLPRVGGQYAFFREAFHPLAGFLHGWALLLIVQSAATAFVAVSCGEYFARLLGLDAHLVPAIAVALLVGLSAFHALGIKPGAILINVLTAGKTLAIVALVFGAMVMLERPTGLHVSPALPAGASGLGLVSAFFAALVPVMFTYGGWQNANFVSEEVKDPLCNLPRAILIGVAIVLVVYLLANVAYVHVLGAKALAASPTPAADLAGVVFGARGAAAVGVLVVVSTFGFLNLALMTAPRVYFAMAQDGLFFGAVARVHPTTRTPVAAIATQGLIAAGFAALAWVNPEKPIYGTLLGYTVFADWIFFSAAGLALIVFRRRMPDAPRPFPVPLYPLVPWFFVLAGLGIVANTFVADTQNALVGTAILAAGVPVYFVWRRLAGRPA